MVASEATRGATMATITRREIRKRGVMGKIFKWGFILFNCFMLYATIAGMMNASTHAQHYSTAAERTGGQVGTVVGVMILAVIWLAGAVILGLFTMMTRGSVTVIEEHVS